MDLNTQQTDELFFGVDIDEEGRASLLDTARWTRILSILGFVYIGLQIVGGIFAGRFFNRAGFFAWLSFGSAGLISTLITATVYFFPVYFLYRFSVLMGPAVGENDQAGVNDALRFFRSAFRYLGILTIVILAFCAIVFLFLILLSPSWRR